MGEKAREKRNVLSLNLNMVTVICAKLTKISTIRKVKLFSSYEHCPRATSGKILCPDPQSILLKI